MTAPLDSQTLEDATTAVMRHYGYTDEQIIEAISTTHEASGCEREGYEWNCEDDEGVSRHPVLDELQRTAEILRVGFEAVQR
jgi:hypothetical protein